MERHLLLTVRVHGDGQGTARFHGMAQGGPEWPPAPGRVFQALVAGVARGAALPDASVPALEWLERRPPPMIAAPRRELGQSVSLFVPNNDADSLADPRDISGIRTKKLVMPSLFAEDQPFHYAWTFSGAAGDAEAIVAAASELYQLGRGVDMAWAVGEVLDAAELDARLADYPGIVYRPEVGVRGVRMLACPIAGTLASLVQRHGTAKLRSEGTGKSARVLFTNPPKPRVLSVSYQRAHKHAVFELRDRTADKPWPWALGRVVKLVETLRDEAAERLRRGLPGHEEAIERTLVGRTADGRTAGHLAERTRIVPLPSIGFAHADRAVRRVLLDVPSGAPLGAADVEWAFSGLEWAHPETGEVSPLVVTRSDSDDMLRHYTGPSRRWRSVTAVALPESAKRRRIEPARQREEAKGAAERAAEEARAVAAVHVALRHAGVRGVATLVRVQREPFDGKGVRAEAFAAGTRFAKERLWHVELELDRPMKGPLLIGDGRFLGLGLMAPPAEPWISPAEGGQAECHPVVETSRATGLFALSASGVVKDAPIALAVALRRAVMARVQHELGDASLDRYFSGHEDDGSKAFADEASHLAFQWDRIQQRLLVLAPHLLERREPTWDERRKLGTLERALDGLLELRAGTGGRFALRRASIGAADPLVSASRRWTSLTPYTVTRHQKRSSASEALVEDVLVECERRRLPRPAVTVLDARGVSGRGLEGNIQLEFAVAVTGPIVLGRTRYLGGGAFVAAEASALSVDVIR